MGRRRSRAPSLLMLGLYLVVVLASPLVHHDFECHLKTPAHCEACQANRPAPRVEPLFALPAPALPAAPHEVRTQGEAPDTLPRAAVPSRAPPA